MCIMKGRYPESLLPCLATGLQGPVAQIRLIQLAHCRKGCYWSRSDLAAVRAPLRGRHGSRVQRVIHDSAVQTHCVDSQEKNSCLKQTSLVIVHVKIKGGGRFHFPPGRIACKQAPQEHKNADADLDNGAQDVKPNSSSFPG